ncbi:hypothetical protein B0H19DRAFT_334273 [Mycena capillaripes]|nr:hypothetical protein B0H19DRAFT_334273 [Mycena capillaripes]
MTIPLSPTAISFIHRRQSLSCRRRESLSQEAGDSNVDSSWTRKVPSVSQMSSSRNGPRVHPIMDAVKGGTVFLFLPVELRVEIFLQFCGMYCPVGKFAEGPIMLLQICRAWTELVLQTPQLWSSFSVDFRSLTGPKHSAFLISAMKGWIDRSRNFPLSFTLHYPVLDATSIDLSQSIVQSLARWRNVTLFAPTASLLPLWEAKPGSSPTLRTLNMETFGPSPFVLKNLGMNWSQITELDLFLIPIPTLDECLHILKEGVSLRRCSLNAACVFSSDDLEILHLPKLEHLQLKMYEGDMDGSSQSRFLTFMRTLSLPRLESFSIGWNVTRGPRWSKRSFDSFIEFLEELGSHLQTLHLGYLPFDTLQILDCLRVVPSIRYLSISLSQADKEHDVINNTFLGALTQQPGYSDGLLPFLERIRLECHGESFNNVALLRFITSRWRYQESPSVGGQLECLDFVSPKRHAEYRPRRFKDVKEGRLEVAAGLRSESSMVQVLSSFMNRDSYGRTICFLNEDFPSDIRSLLVFS